VPPAIPLNTCTNNVDLQTADTQLNAMLFSYLAVADFKSAGRLTVEFENLNMSDPASPTVVEAADLLRTKMGFMTNNYLAALPGNGVGAACSGGFILPVGCKTSAEYLALLDAGIFPCYNAPSDEFCHSDTVRSVYLEVFAPDVLQFPDAIFEAHKELLKNP
jgi:hypothetical protein